MNKGKQYDIFSGASVSSSTVFAEVSQEGRVYYCRGRFVSIEHCRTRGVEVYLSFVSANRSAHQAEQTSLGFILLFLTK